jgi:preprotein translocase subunit YajC
MSGFYPMLAIVLAWGVGVFADGQAAVPAAAKPSMAETLFPFAIILVLFYFFLGRPQQKKMKEHQNFLSSLKRGDQVVTSGGIYGEVTGLTDKVVTLQIADNVRIKIARAQIVGNALKEGNP